MVYALQTPPTTTTLIGLKMKRNILTHLKNRAFPLGALLKFLQTVKLLRAAKRLPFAVQLMRQ
jgi:hypothetical protein